MRFMDIKFIDEARELLNLIESKQTRDEKITAIVNALRVANNDGVAETLEELEYAFV